MDFRQVFSDDEVCEEFLDRFDDLLATAGPVARRPSGRLESLDSLDFVPATGRSPSKDAATSVVEEMREGTYGGSDPGLEAIIERFTRPVYLVQDSRFHRPQDF